MKQHDDQNKEMYGEGDGWSESFMPGIEEAVRDTLKKDETDAGSLVQGQ